MSDLKVSARKNNEKGKESHDLDHVFGNKNYSTTDCKRV
jgi:hypothetical protein